MNNKKLIMVFVVSCVTTPPLSAKKEGMKSVGDRCQPIEVPMCRNMPYNLTSFPNFLGHENQAEVMIAMEQYSISSWTNCSPYLTFLLCSFYIPLCTFDFTSKPIPPCREVCEAVLEDCKDIQGLLEFPLPSRIDCDSLPPKDGDVCIAPETQDNAMIINDGFDFECRCFKIQRLKKQLYYKSHFKYAIRGRCKAIQVFGDLTVTNIHVYDVFKQSKVKIMPNAEYTLWTNSSCLCPRIELGREYLLLGFEDIENQRLLHLSNSIALEWHKQHAEKILKWDKLPSAGMRANTQRKKKHRRRKQLEE
ncbi:hypothetical protein QYM36_012778 [Artemia franciscana]|uniref:Secreted frizzled-related protein 3 n=1 Tax=Artemia franciscana TaxID=6661 RepID=A0AA88HQ37_ARTSF|nr:hypothetical protein QYM36_012778 [Artemia franciscana]